MPLLGGRFWRLAAWGTGVLLLVAFLYSLLVLVAGL